MPPDRSMISHVSHTIVCSRSLRVVLRSHGFLTLTVFFCSRESEQNAFLSLVRVPSLLRYHSPYSLFLLFFSSGSHTRDKLPIIVITIKVESPRVSDNTMFVFVSLFFFVWFVRFVYSWSLGDSGRPQTPSSRLVDLVVRRV